MRESAVQPTGIERRLGSDDVIVTKTDLQGRLTYVNQVFLEIARYEEHEVLGRPHNIVRHPDMPRTVFALLWQEIAAGREIFAYVNNLASDGAHYWVFAHVTPSFADGQIIGYHSNRRSPDPGTVRKVNDLYLALVAEERRHHHPGEAMEASGAMLAGILAEHQVTYDEFVWSITKVAA